MALIARGSGDFADVPRAADDLAAILYTSGTTGRSKGAMLTHENLASNARTLVASWRFTRADVLIHALPIFHTHGLFVATNTLLLAGGAMILLPRFDPAEVLAVMPRATSLMGVPDLLRAPPAASRPHARSDRPYAPLRVGLGAAPRRDPRRVRRRAPATPSSSATA